MYILRYYIVCVLLFFFWFVQDFSTWNNNDLINWLKSLDSRYSKYCAKITELDIDGEDLEYLKDEDQLEKWGIHKPSHKNKIWNNIKLLIKILLNVT